MNIIGTSRSCPPSHPCIPPSPLSPLLYVLLLLYKTRFARTLLYGDGPEGRFLLLRDFSCCVIYSNWPQRTSVFLKSARTIILRNSPLLELRTPLGLRGRRRGRKSRVRSDEKASLHSSRIFQKSHPAAWCPCDRLPVVTGSLQPGSQHASP